MKITCLQENLHRGLSIVGKAVASKTTMPVLNNILLETDNGRLKLVATNLEVGITHWIDCQVEEEGAITVPAKLLTDFVADLPPDKIDIVLDEPRHTLSLQCGRHEAHIKGIDASEFPVVPALTNQPIVAHIKAEALQEAINQVAFAAASDDSRPVLTGVLLRFEQGRMTAAAADGFRLAERKVEVNSNGASEQAPIIVPSRALIELSRIISSGDEMVDIAITPNRNQVLFHAENVDLVSRLIDGPFVNYAQIIPGKYTSRMVVDTSSFLKAMKIASYFARDSMNIVKLRMEPGSSDGLTPGILSITANAAEAGDNLSQIDTIIEGDGGQVAFNAKYVIDVLGVINTPQVALETLTSTSPGVVRPVGSEDYLHVIMPMNLFK